MIQFSIDRGGTFTDIYAEHNGTVYIKKLLSEDPANYSDASSEGIRRVIEEISGKPVPKDAIPAEKIGWIRMGTTVATNALLERKGERTALLITKGFKDLLEIGYQVRRDLFNPDIEKWEKIYETVVEIEERVIPGKNGFQVLEEPSTEDISNKLTALKKQGIRSVAVVLMHAYGFNRHEQKIGKIARELGFAHVALSSEVMPVIKITDRGYTTVIDAYLTPKLKEYTEGFRSGFAGTARDVSLLFMQSAGALVEAEKFRGANAILSGPAGGVVGYASSFYAGSPIIGFDMGGTSTDVSRYNGSYDISYENTLDGVPIRTPHVDILTVAAGGGSRLFYRNSLFTVGPESAGSHPGPVCYKKGGQVSITDANLVLGRIVPEFFPAVFGENENEPLDREAARAAFQELTETINSDYTKRGLPPLSIEEAALGFITVANENMIKPIKEVSTARGFEMAEHILACFGGAGPQHACAIARILGIGEVLVHRYAGILSAYGIGKANMGKYANRTVNMEYGPGIQALLERAFEELIHEGLNSLGAEPRENISIRKYLALRFEDTGNSLEIEEPADKDYETKFREAHTREFGFDFAEKPIYVDEVRVYIQAAVEQGAREKIAPAAGEALSVKTARVWFNCGYSETPVFLLEELFSGHRIPGPAMIINNTSTILIEPCTLSEITEFGDVRIFIDPSQGPHSGQKTSNSCAEQSRSIEPRTSNVLQPDSISLAVFNNIFTSVAERMGRVLQKTAVSTNIKERLDFSCALFDGRGNLAANAPHIPVHLGSMSHTVTGILEKFEGDIHSGDIFITNAPYEGGSHLPDITVATPFVRDGTLLFWVAARGHHADIGGITPGSMPPFSNLLREEGAVIESFKIVEREHFNEKRIRELLLEAGARRIEDNISDIKAQISANRKGIELLEETGKKYSFEVLSAYMSHIRDIAEDSVRKLLARLIPDTTLSAVDYMDDGTLLSLKVSSNKETGEAVFDFSGSGIESFSNINCPIAVTSSAVMYVMRVMIAEDLPLNGGFLRPIRIVVPGSSILNPSKYAAVAGGNVTTSQRIVDLIFRAFRYCAASCGCMNNVSFGSDFFGYYETIAGGAGAGDGYSGASAVHTHMTNTRITDPEILEDRYPVILREFSIRENSGGKGLYSGGKGVVRELEFLEEIKVSLLTERRSFAPWGMAGGEDGKRGRNSLLKKEGEQYRQLSLGGKCVVRVEPGDRVRIETPGGGGFGSSN
ncbi:MAG: 5-oxoprolinase [bacterium]|nr:5-oxoprolinase [bacterium]